MTGWVFARVESNRELQALEAPVIAFSQTPRYIDSLSSLYDAGLGPMSFDMSSGVRLPFVERLHRSTRLAPASAPKHAGLIPKRNFNEYKTPPSS